MELKQSLKALPSISPKPSNQIEHDRLRSTQMELAPSNPGVRLLTALLISLLLLAIGMGRAEANGVPVQIFLDFLPFKSTWQPASEGRGVAVVSANDELVRVMAQNLPAPPQGRAYFAWLERVEGSFLAVGALSFSSDGTASLDQPMEDLPYSENFAYVLVSLEAVDALGANPADEIALAGRLPNPVALPPVNSQAPPLLPITGAAGAGIDSTGFLPFAALLLGGLGVLGLMGRRGVQLRRSRIEERRTQRRSRR